MPRTKISEFSATAGSNTDIDGINIAEGCSPSGINDAIRELMAQLKDFQAGTAGDSFNGPVGTTTPAAGAFTNFSASGTFALTGDQVQISEGGTGQTTANAAFNALAPSQSTHAGKYLKTDGTNTSWDAIEINTADITGTLPIANGGTGLTALGTGVQTALGQNVTGSGGIVLASSPSLTTPNLGTPSAVTLTNATGLPLSTGVTGTLATTNGGTGLTSFTANGVVYASSSSALTTGSALTFDGTNIDLATVGAKVNFATTGSATRNYIGGSADGYSLEMVMQRGASQPLSYKQNFSVGHEWGIAGSGAMTLTSTGLGIGTSSPAYKLDVNGVTRLGAGTPAILAGVGGAFAGGQGELYTIGTNTMGIGTTGAAALRLYTNSTLQATLDSSGNLGIGTSSPLDRLDVVSATSNRSRIRSSGASEAVLLFQNSATGTSTADGLYLGIVGAADAYLWNYENNPLIFGTNNTERARITSGGDLLINTTTSSGLVTVARGASGVGIGVLHSGDGGISAAIRASYTASTGTAYQFDCYFNGGRVGYISSTSTATAYNTSSDYRLKDNPQPLTGSGAFIDALKPKTWDWKSGGKGVGFIAHEVQEVSPGTVVGTKDAVDEEGKPVYQAMEYGSAEFIANIIAELQSLRARVAQLEAK